MAHKFDFLVIGGGVAGLSYALEAAKVGTVGVLFKRGLSDSATAWAQGGIAAVTTDDDQFSLHVEDTLKAGAYLSNRKIVELVVTEGPKRVEELVGRGASFDKVDRTHFHLHREGGHSRRRIFHSADATGWEVQRTLLEAARENSNIRFFEDVCAVDLVTTKKLGASENEVLGAYVLTGPGQIEVFAARKVLMAAGGAGKVYLYTSNPDVATGDGIAMCYRAGARVANMEFFQFHPTCLFDPRAKTFLITEAMRGEGALLKRTNGEPFMERYHPDAELASRDIVARAIDSEMKAHGDEYVLLDISHKDPKFVETHFPTVYGKCLHSGYDITKEPIPVVPAAHYCCGGVVCDEWGQTDIKDLYVAGESACTGLHGANRLASNSLLEGLVFGHRAAQHSIESLSEKSEYKIPSWDAGSAVDSDEQVIIAQNWDEIRRYMWNYVGIVRSNKRLERALRRNHLIRQEIQDYYWNFTVTRDLLELRNLSLTAELVIRSAMARKESRGLHYTIDYPEQATDPVDTIIDPSLPPILDSP